MTTKEDWLTEAIDKWGPQIRREKMGRCRIQELTGLSKHQSTRLGRALSNRCTMIVSIWDVHVPDHFKPGWASLMSFLDEQQPDEIILGGDFVELESASAHRGTKNVDIDYEIDSAKELLTELCETCPEAEMHFLEGNHETRLQRTVRSAIPNLESAVKGIDELLELDEYGIQFYPRHAEDKRSQVLYRGDFAFIHGYWANKHHAYKHLDQYGYNVAYGHKHNPQMYCQSSINGTRFSYSFPCMRDRNPSWMEGKPSPWVNGFGITYVTFQDKARHYQVIMDEDGSFVWNGWEYYPE